MIALLHPLVAACAALAPLQRAAAEVGYVAVPLSDVAYDEGAAPSFEGALWCDPRDLAALAPYVVLEGEGAGYIGLPWTPDWSTERAELGASVLAIEFPRASDGAARQTLRGRVYLPDAQGRGLLAHPFTLSTDTATTAPSDAFEGARRRHFAWRLERDLPGAGWWRHRANIGGGADPEETNERFTAWRSSRSADEVDRSFALLTGGRAVSENLRLDDIVRRGAPAVATVPLGEIEGIRTAELDWTGRDQCSDEGIDRLAHWIPADHHAAFLPSFGAFVAVIDELRANGTPVLDALASRMEDARVQARYEAQLALELDAAARVFGPMVVRSLAITGGDPYLRTGSDVALLFDCADADAFQRFALLRIEQRAAAVGVEVTTQTVGAVSLKGAANATRDLSAWVARDGDVVIVTNSARLAARLIGVHRGDEVALGALAEYRYFRARYPLGAANEAAFVVLPDRAIRRWCGPKWRIASARRVRAGALLADAAAADLSVRVGLEEQRSDTLLSALPDFGALVTSGGGPRSERYGTARFLTPIAELDFTYVTPEERDGYEGWRRDYERIWSNAFDPIGARLSLSKGGLELDLTVMPLALRSDYRDWIDITGEVRLAPDGGDPHPTALAHMVFAVDHEARLIKQIEGALSMVAPDLERPLGWVGDHVAVWLDDDQALLDAARAAEDVEEFMDEHGFDVPVGVLVDVKDPLRMTMFLGALKALLQSAAPGVMSWDTREATLPSGAKRAYVAIEPIEGGGWGDTPSLYYGIAPGRLIASLREDVVIAGLARATEPSDEARVVVPKWVGESLAVRFAEGFKDVLSIGLVERELRDGLRRRAFSVLPILNELRAVAPGEEPRALQARVFGSTVRCPGGGDLVWNAAHATYESTVFGCPAAPRDGEWMPAALRAMTGLSMGLTFDRLDERTHGLRARARVERR